MIPEISIIVPVYNVEAYLSECLNSVLGQSVSNWECILVDDASTDGSRAVALQFVNKDSRFRLFTRRQNGGLSVARNDGLAHALAPWVTFLDSDDMVHPRFLEYALGATSSDVDIVSFSMSHSSDILSLTFRPSFKQISGRELLLGALYRKNRALNGSASAKIYRKSLFDEAMFVPGLHYEDLDLLGRILPSVNFVMASAFPVYFYRLRPGSILHQVNSSRFDILKVTARLEEDYTADPELLAAARDRRFAANCDMLRLMLKNDMRSRPEYEQCISQIKRLRPFIIRNRRSRLKNRVAALISFLVWR